MIIPTFPTWESAESNRRSEHTALRKRMLSGEWSDDLTIALRENFSSLREDAIGKPDMSSNVFKQTTQALSALYMEAPSIISNGESGELTQNGGLLDRSGLWPLMQRVQYYTIGMRECLLRVDVNDTMNPTGLSYRVVTADMVEAHATISNPSTPLVIKEFRLRKECATGDLIWTIDHFDISNPNNPIYKITTTGTKKKDLTVEYLGSEQSGEFYPYIGQDKKPFLPYSLYHAEIHGGLFDPYYNRELIEGSLVASVMYSYFVHLARDCAHPQRYALGVKVAGLNVVKTASGTESKGVIETDPSSILMFTPDLDEATGVQPQFGHYTAGADIDKMLEAITIYERGLAALSGIKASDVQKASGDPRSGYAIAISRSSQREVQRKFSPSMRRGDLNTITISAKISNMWLGTNLPESGYSIKYYNIPLSPEEMRATMDDLSRKIDMGLISKIDAVMILNPEYDRNDARNHLLNVKQENII